MKNAPVISVITVSFNAEAYLKACLDSIETQREVSFEHIVVDGGSSDSSVAMLASRKSSNLHWISEADSGIAEAMNKGIRLARGEWLLFIQADDLLSSPDSLSQAKKHLIDPTSIVSFQVRKMHASGSHTIIRNPGWCLKTNFKTTIGHQGAFIHRELFEHLGEYDTNYKIAMDYEWFMRAFRASTPIIRPEGIIAEMSADGISSQTDWASLSYRFSEEKRIHLQHTPNILWKLIYKAYWTIYPSFRKLKEYIKRSPPN